MHDGNVTIAEKLMGEMTTQERSDAASIQTRSQFAQNSWPIVELNICTRTSSSSGESSGQPSSSKMQGAAEDAEQGASRDGEWREKEGCTSAFAADLESDLLMDSLKNN
jgi:hypothetical protein